MTFIEKLFFIFCLSAATKLNAFTLTSSSPPRYATNNVEIRIANNDCTNIGITAQGLMDMVNIAVGQYWNAVPTSRIRFSAGSFVDVATDASLTDMVSAINENQIIIACSEDTSLFEATNILAVGTITTSSPARGVVAINNISGSQFADLSELNQKATVAHEFGHAIGIGHSTHEYALMYYALSEAIKQDALARDDADAITYLYPKDSSVPFVLGACGQIEDPSNPNFWFNIVFALLIVFMGLFLTGSMSLQFKSPKNA